MDGLWMAADVRPKAPFKGKGHQRFIPVGVAFSLPGTMSSNERAPLLAGNADSETAYDATTSAVTTENARGAPKASVVTFLAAASGGILLAALDSTIITTSYARIGSEMNQLQRASWIATSYMMSITAFQPLYGKLSDIFGRKSCLLFAHFIFGVGCFACAVANDMTSLIVGRMITGIGGAGLITVVTVTVSDVVPLRQRGTWQAIINLIYSVGTATGAPLGGVLIDHFSWRWGFAVQVPICLVGFLAIWFAFPENIKREDVNGQEEDAFTKLRRVDFLGSLLLVIVVFSFLVGLDKGSNEAWTSPVAYISFIITALGTIGLVIVESNPSLAKEPVAPVKFFKNRNLVASYVTAMSLMSVGTLTVFQIALYAQVLNRKSASQASLCLLPIIVALVAGNLVGGIMTQRQGKFKFLTTSGLVGGVVFAFLSTLSTYCEPRNWDLIAVTMFMAILSFFAGIAINTLLVATIASIDPPDQAAATALSFLFRTLGSVLGLSLSGAILQQVLRIVLVQKLSGLPYDIEELVRRVRESMEYIDSLDPAVQTIVRDSYRKALTGVFGYGTFQCALALLTSLFIRDRSLESSK